MVIDEPQVSKKAHYGVADVAKFFNRKPVTVYRWIAAGRMKAKINRASGKKYVEGSEILRVWGA